MRKKKSKSASPQPATARGEQEHQTPLLGQVTLGANNIYLVKSGDSLFECRIKGKVLKSETAAYNPLAVGDWVWILPDPIVKTKAWLTSLKARTSFIQRFNKKRKAAQILAANIDQLICVTSTQKPPFRPRFTDRLLVTAQSGHTTPLIFVNKCDLPLAEEDEARLSYYKKIGYMVLYGSAVAGLGLAELRRHLQGKTSAFVGQSGVGKSSLLNALKPGLNLKVGEISDKFDRGAHITTYAILLELDGETKIIDTPGIRELEVAGILPSELGDYFPDFREAATHCSFNSCQHLDEPGCRIKAETEAGRIHPDRYESYVRLYQALKDTVTESYG